MSLTPLQIKERRLRISITLWAYAYEFQADSLVSDGKFDRVAKLIDTSISTGHPVLDKFFKEKFGPETGQWVRDHPELDKLAALYERIKDNWTDEARTRL